MSSNILFASIDLLSIPLVVYGIYWAFNVRRALAVHLYRNQAFGVGLVGIGFVWLYITRALNDYAPNSNLAMVLGVLTFDIPPLLAFYWIDASMRAARRSDPLLRDTGHWSKIRLWLWGWNILAFLTLVGIVVGATISGEIGAGPPPLPLFIYVLSPIFVTVITGLVFLPRAAKKSGDQRLHRHLLWFALFIFLGLFFFVMIFIAGGLENAIPTTVANAAGGYSLYKSVRWLVPISRISPLETKSVEK
jgi:hypothetical protein